MSETGYRKLTGKKRSVTGYSQLWLGSDHLLLVNSTRFAESYQRFLLADIQAITVTDGPDVFWVQILAGLAAIGWGLLALVVSATFGKWFFGISGALLLAWALADVARGPRCRCLLYTAVSQLRLGPVSRQNTARSFLAALAPLVEAVQGPAEEEALRPAVGESPAPPVQPSRGFGAAPVLFGLYLMNAVLVLLVYRIPQSGGAVIFPLSITVEIALAIITLVQSRANLLRAINAIAVAGIALGVMDVSALVREVRAAVVGGALVGPTPPDFNAILLPPAHAVLVASVWRAAAGVLGLILFAAARRRQTQP